MLTLHPLFRVPTEINCRYARLRYTGSAATWDSPSTRPAPTATRTPTCPTGHLPEPPNKPVTPPAAYLDDPTAWRSDQPPQD